MHTTPLLVNTTVNSMTEYVGSLAKTGRKNYTATMKKNKRLTYSLIEYEPEIIKDNYFFPISLDKIDIKLYYRYRFGNYTNI